MTRPSARCPGHETMAGTRDGVLVEGLLPPQPVLANLFPVIRGVDDDRVVHVTVGFKGVEDFTDELVSAVAECPVSDSGAHDFFVGDLDDAGALSPPLDVGVAVLDGFGWDGGHWDAAVVFVVVGGAGDEWLVREH